MTLPFDGIRVLDFTQLEQGPSGTLILADFGAEVIKIERIDMGEIGRGQMPRHRGMSCHWAANNRNKLSLSVDLKHPEGRRIIHELAKDADIAASNFRPGVMEKLGQGYEDLRAINPRIICAYASGYGQSGPYRDRRGQDLAGQAMGGLMDLTGEAGGAPTNVGTFALDYLAAMQFALGMVTALVARERTGVGQVVDTCLLNAALTIHHQEATAFLNTGQRYPRPPHGIAHAHNTPLYGRYRASDGEWLVLIGEFYITEPWRRVTRALGLSPDVVDDPRFQTIDGLRHHTDAAHQVLAEGFARLTRDDAIRRLEQEDVLTAPVNAYPEVFADPQILHNEMVIATEHPGIGPLRFVGLPIKLSATPGQVRLNPPTVGEHNIPILGRLGYSREEITRLQAEGVVGAEAERQSAGEPPAWGDSATAS
jgi:crotonobetainyl-CoA:carnitine CoA-transferase CaiB-like acyl-CoA transferase